MVIRSHRDLAEVLSVQPSDDVIQVPPTGRSRGKTNTINVPLYCQECNHPLRKLDPELLGNVLSHREKVAQDSGRVKFIGWQCSFCSRFTPQMHIRAYLGY